VKPASTTPGSKLPDQPANGLTGGIDSARDVRFDAFVLADTLRTDRARLRPLTRDSEATQVLRTVDTRRELLMHRVALANQLRAHLQAVFPGAVDLFADLALLSNTVAA
jgi:hypothetical protein